MIRRLLEKRSIFVGILVLTLIITSLGHTTVLAARDRKAPTTPTNLKTTSVSETSVSLTWSASTDNVGVKAYDIYKDSKLIGSTAVTTFTVNSLTPATTYKFYVKAKDAAGNVSGASNILSVTTNSTVVTPPPTDPTPTTKTSRIVGYYAAWAAYSGFTPDKIDATKLTHINYAFANIGSDLKIALGYPDVDPTNIAKLNALKQVNPNLKTIISVGGWSWSGRFSDVALTDASRAAFADSCVDFIVKYGFDGVDIDWEYPVSGGLSTNVKRPEDKVNFTLLMKTLREKLDARGLVDGKKYILTFAGACTNSFVNNTEMAKLAQYVDYANIMSYDIHGSWDTYTDLVAPLYTNTDVSPQYKYSVDAGIKAWINAGFPAGQINMGVPFYGYQYNAVANVNRGLYQTYSGSASISYANIVGNYLNNSSFVRYFHTESMVPWLFNGTTFISYEDPQSIGIKADYVNTKGLGGAMIWELSQDPSGVLLKALYDGLK